jgi:hypothetical protein
MPMVLSVEGAAFMNRWTWTTHKVLGVFEDRDAALEHPELASMTDEDVVILTNLDDGKVERIKT